MQQKLLLEMYVTSNDFCMCIESNSDTFPEFLGIRETQKSDRGLEFTSFPMMPWDKGQPGFPQFHDFSQAGNPSPGETRVPSPTATCFPDPGPRTSWTN